MTVPSLIWSRPGKSVGLVHESDALGLEIVGRVGVVDEHAEHVHGPVGLLAHALGDPEGVHHAVAVPARRDLEHFHLLSSLRELYLIPTNRSFSGSSEPGSPRTSW